MKKIIYYLSYLVLVLTTCIACNDDNEILIRPSVAVSDVSVMGNKASMNITVKNATTCAYILYKQQEAETSTAEVMEKGTRLNINGSQTITLENLEWETDYILKIAVTNKNNEYGFCLQEIKTAAKGTPMVEIKDAYTENSRLIFTVHPTNAVKCAYICYKEGEASPTIESVLASGFPINASAPSIVTTDILEQKTNYIVMIVVENESGIRNLTTAQLSTGREIHGKDLGEGANCYIVTEAGDYHFKPLKVDGSKISGIVNTDWIWTTSDVANSTQQNIIKEIFWANGCINFTTTGKEGNAIIAGFNKNKQIVWLWQIWCTDQPETMRYQNGAEFMDRHLGATSADPNEWKKTIGLLWQWGRNVPIFGGYADENFNDENQIFSEAQKWTVLNKNYVEKWRLQQKAATIEQSLAAPTTMFVDNKAVHWQEAYDLTLWGKQKTNYDPCPKGYKIPQTSQWEEFSNAEINKNKNVTYADDFSGLTYTYNGKTAYWPAGCGRECFDGGLGFYEKTMVWSGTSELVTNIYAGTIDAPTVFRMAIQMQNSNNYTKSAANGSFALYVRCVTDK